LRTTWVDIPSGDLWCVDGVDLGVPPRRLLSGDEPLGVAVPHSSGGWICGRGRGISLVDDDGLVVCAITLEPKGVRLNDGKVDPAGRFWVGSKAEDNGAGRGSLWCLDLDGVVTRALRGLTIANGLGWSPDESTMYVTDSATGRIAAYDYDVSTGSLGPARHFVEIDPSIGAPDGLCVDSEGYVWVAIWGGRQVRRYSPGGHLSGEIEVAASHVTSCAFAGQRLDELVITSARDELSPTQLANEPDAGKIFTANVPATGIAGRRASVVRDGWLID